MNGVANHENLPEISQHVQPSKLTRAERRLWLLESIRANMLCYAAEIEWRAKRGCSLPFDGIVPSFAMCDEMRDSVLKDVDKIRATYDKNWVTDELGTRPPESESEIITKTVVARYRQRLALGRNVAVLPSPFGAPRWCQPSPGPEVSRQI